MDWLVSRCRFRDKHFHVVHFDVVDQQNLRHPRDVVPPQVLRVGEFTDKILAYLDQRHDEKALASAELQAQRRPSAAADEEPEDGDAEKDCGKAKEISISVQEEQDEDEQTADEIAAEAFYEGLVEVFGKRKPSRAAVHEALVAVFQEDVRAVDAAMVESQQVQVAPHPQCDQLVQPQALQDQELQKRSYGSCSAEAAGGAGAGASSCSGPSGGDVGASDEAPRSTAAEASNCAMKLPKNHAAAPQFVDELEPFSCSERRTRRSSSNEWSCTRAAVAQLHSLEDDLQKVEGEIGCVLWRDACDHFLDFLERFLPSWNRRRVIELGAGSGYVGFALVADGASVCVTDLEEILPQMKVGAVLNLVGGKEFWLDPTDNERLDKNRMKNKKNRKTLKAGAPAEGGGGSASTALCSSTSSSNTQFRSRLEVRACDWVARKLPEGSCSYEYVICCEVLYAGRGVWPGLKDCLVQLGRGPNFKAVLLAVNLRVGRKDIDDFLALLGKDFGFVRKLWASGSGNNSLPAGATSSSCTTHTSTSLTDFGVEIYAFSHVENIK